MQNAHFNSISSSFIISYQTKAWNNLLFYSFSENFLMCFLYFIFLMSNLFAFELYMCIFCIIFYCFINTNKKAFSNFLSLFFVIFSFILYNFFWEITFYIFYFVFCFLEVIGVCFIYFLQLYGIYSPVYSFSLQISLNISLLHSSFLYSFSFLLLLLWINIIPPFNLLSKKNTNNQHKRIKKLK